MKLIRFSKLFDLRVIVCSLACLAGSFANAQVSHGTFNLPRETRWGTAVFAPGAYSYTLNSASVQGIITVRAPGSTAMITVSAGLHQSPESAASHLLLVTEGGQTSVRELYLGGLGMTLRFQRPKAKYAILAQAPPLKQSVLIAEARK
jgi:hypothetical protein